MAALGLMTIFHYAVSHDSPENKKFVEAATKAIGSAEQLSFPAVGAYDGMHVIYKMIEATDGKQDAQKAVDAVKGLSWTSPRGPVSIEPETPPHHAEHLSARSRQGCGRQVLQQGNPDLRRTRRIRVSRTQ